VDGIHIHVPANARTEAPEDKAPPAETRTGAAPEEPLAKSPHHAENQLALRILPRGAVGRNGERAHFVECCGEDQGK
jgi:hypothetical protein